MPTRRIKQPALSSSRLCDRPAPIARGRGIISNMPISCFGVKHRCSPVRKNRRQVRKRGNILTNRYAVGSSLVAIRLVAASTINICLPPFACNKIHPSYIDKGTIGNTWHAHVTKAFRTAGDRINPECDYSDFVF